MTDPAPAPAPAPAPTESRVPAKEGALLAAQLNQARLNIIQLRNVIAQKDQVITQLLNEIDTERNEALRAEYGLVVGMTVKKDEITGENYLVATSPA